jgi:hypothetical protein
LLIFIVFLLRQSSFFLGHIIFFILLILRHFINLYSSANMFFKAYIKNEHDIIGDDGYRAQVRSLSQLRNDFADVDEFYLEDGGGPGNGAFRTSKNGLRRASTVVNGGAPALPRSRSEPNLKGTV